VIGILTRTGRGIRTVAKVAYADAVRPEDEAPTPARRVRRRKVAKRAVRKSKTKRANRKTARGK